MNIFHGLDDHKYTWGPLFFQPSHSSVLADLSLVDLVRPASLVSCFTVSPISPLNLLSLISLICPGSTSGVGSVNQQLCVLWVLIILGPSVSQRNTTSNTSFFGNIHHVSQHDFNIFLCWQSLFFLIFRDLSQEWMIMTTRKEGSKGGRKPYISTNG